MTWILGSASPRRREILAHLGLTFIVRAADVDEESDESDATVLVEQLAARKARAVGATLSDEERKEAVILASDTVVLSPDGEILGKPRDRADAERMLRALSGRRHRVISGVAVLRGEELFADHEITEVSFSHLSEDVLARYLDTSEPYDKAGAYGIQDTAALWIEGICGDYFNVVGLPVYRLETLLKEKLGLSLWKTE